MSLSLLFFGAGQDTFQWTLFARKPVLINNSVSTFLANGWNYYKVVDRLDWSFSLRNMCSHSRMLMAPRNPIRQEMLIHTPVDEPRGKNLGWGVLPKDTGTVWSGRAGDWTADLSISGRTACVKLETRRPNQAWRIISYRRQELKSLEIKTFTA